jgi:hypothetical protein
VTTHRPVVCDIRAVKSNVPDATPDLDFLKDFAFSRFSRVHQLEYAFVRPQMCRDHELRDFARAGLLNPNEGWATLFYQKRTNDADFTIGIGSRLRRRLLYTDRLVRLHDIGIGSRLRRRLLYTDRLARVDLVYITSILF